jgi:hypothetical protein
MKTSGYVQVDGRGARKVHDGIERAKRKTGRRDDFLGW